METLVRPTTTETPCEYVCKQHDAFSKPHIECGHTLTSKFSIHKMSDQYFVTGCFSRSGLEKKNVFPASDLSVFPSRCAPADLEPVQQSRVAFWVLLFANVVLMLPFFDFSQLQGLMNVLRGFIHNDLVLCLMQFLLLKNG